MSSPTPPWEETAAAKALTASQIAGVVIPSAVGGIAQSAGNAAATKSLTTGATNASNITTATGQQLQQLYNQNYAAQQKMLEPYTTAGTQNLAALQAGLQPGGGLIDPYGKTFSFDGSDLASSPGYQFNLDQGQKAITASENAMGTRFSGGAMKAAARYGTDYANTYFDDAFKQAQSSYGTNFNQFETEQANRYNRLQTAANAGLQATNAGVVSNQNYVTESGNTQLATSENLANLQMQLAQAQAAGNVAQASTLQNAIQAVSKGVQGLQTVAALKNLAPGAASNAASLAAAAAPASAAASAAGTAAIPISAGAAPLSTAAATMAATGTGVGTGVVPGAVIAGEGLGEAAGAGAAAAGAAGAGEAGAAAAGLGGLSTSTGASIAAATAGEGVAPGAVAGAAAGAGAAPLSGYAAGGLITSHGAMIGMLTNPITIGIGAALLGAYALIKSQVHWTANTFTKNVQTQFGNNLVGAVQAFNTAAKSGQLTQAQGAQAVQQIQELTQQFEQARTTFAAKGSHENTVATQAEAEMTKDFGSNFSTLLGDLNTQVQGLAV